MTARLALVLDCLLPGDPARGWPAASAVRLGDKARALAASRDEPSFLDDFAQALPTDFERLSDAARVDALKALEATEPERFGRLILYAYGAYYSALEVRRVVEERTGYPARPPQPQGYDLPPFDEDLLKTVRRRAPFWRPVPDR